MRLSYPSNIKIIHVPCTGRVDVIHILKAIEHGADASMSRGDWRVNVISWKEI